MADLILSPTTRTKTKTIEAANKIRHGSPKLHEVLRQRCRARMREKRGQLFNRRRIGVDTHSENLQDTLTNIVRKEFNDIISTDWGKNTETFSSIFDSPLEFEEALELEAEIISEEEQWIMEEYNKVLQYEEERLAQEVVFCPICLKTGLEESSDFILCNNCNFKVPAQISLMEFQERIQESANTHGLQCNQRPYFTVFPFNNNIALYLTCEQCSFFSPVFGEGPI